MDEMINERVTQKENEMHAAYDEKIRNFEERSAISIRWMRYRSNCATIGNKTFNVR